MFKNNKPGKWFLVATFILVGTTKTIFSQSLELTQGPFKPTWESLKNYKTPDWFRDAKFGIWAHWGPQCQPEAGDWYARNMYIQGHKQYNTHIEKYGHPSKFGFKDVINLWKAQNFNPEELVALYKSAGAKYFVGMAVHHDNFDLWNSKYQPWNSVNMGPKQDIVGKWALAAKKNDLHFGVSIHARSAWSWYEVAQSSDKTGPMAGIPYDGKLTAADGKGLWWEGYDPQDLYEQNHKPSPVSENRKLQGQNPGEKATPAYNQKFYNRVLDVVNKYQPDLVYFDDYKLPLGMKDGRDAYGLNLVANIYNQSILRNKGNNQAIVNTKALTDTEQLALTNDLEVGTERTINPIPWQSDACIGSWHYNSNLKQYKSSKAVIEALVDVVSKNGNLLLSIPIRADGTIDDAEKKVLNEIGKWLAINGEAIYGTRPWTIFGEGPSTTSSTESNSKGDQPLFRKNSNPYLPSDFRFTTKNNSLYAIGLAWPETNKICIESLKLSNNKKNQKITQVSLLGAQDKLTFQQTSKGLEVTLPNNKLMSTAYTLKIDGLSTSKN
ncbi:alpha-L-fucosidase [Pedobacter glucosidilyticus]|uniref:alpha-L-fucosidase n=1 Tax=Pedobacter glucosidilyticus TaxID=1122941 RepID=UPI0026EC2951|nr:alpha-L-fucosidase [Pedobacter glucosidilyticus]